MKTKAVRLHGKEQVKLDVIDLPPPGERELRARIVTDSLCFSTYKAWQQGENHKRTPDDLASDPIIVGHEFAGVIEEVGEDLKEKFAAGEKFLLQPAIFYDGPLFVHGGVYGAPGYSFPFCGGAAQDVIIPQPVIDSDAVLTFKDCPFFEASLAEPLSCIIGAANEQYHCDMGKHKHIMGIKDGGSLAILGAGGPMGLAMLDYFLHSEKKPSLIMAVEIDPVKIEKARNLFSSKKGETALHFVNPREEDLIKASRQITNNRLFDDVFTMFPASEILETADKLLGEDGTNNFFAGPADKELKASINFYQVHYSSHKHIGSSGGNTDDLQEAITMMEDNKINPAQMIYSIGGLDAVVGAIPRLPELAAGKNLIYTGITMPLTPISEFGEKSLDKSLSSELRELYSELNKTLQKHGGLWNEEAEEYILSSSAINFRL